MGMIDKDALVEILMEAPEDTATNERFAEWLEEQESSEIVYCRECKHIRKDLLGFQYCQIGMYHCLNTLPNDFYCAKGER